MKILLVEDKPENIESAKLQLSKHCLTIAKTGFEAAQIVRSRQFPSFDLVLTDLKLPMGRSEYSLQQGGRPFFDVESKFPSSAILDVGYIVALACAMQGLPCIMVSNINGHDDPMAALIDEAFFRFNIEARKDARRKNSRHRWRLFLDGSMTTLRGNILVKDWLGAIKTSPWRHYLRETK